MAKVRLSGTQMDGLKLPTEVANALGGATFVEGKAVRLEAARAVQRPQEITVDESREILELEFEGGIRQFIGLQDFRRDYGLVPSRDAADVLDIPMRFGRQEETRGLAANLTLKAFRVIGFPLEERAAEKVADYFEAKVQHGLHAWKDDRELEQETVNKPGQLPVDKPLLVFLHGTASNTIGSFGGLAEKQPEIWQSLLKGYKHRIYAFEHATLSKSPIENVIDLLKVLPTGARLHLVSHSRGGLVGELLCRADVRRGEKQSRAPFDDLELKQFGSQHKQQRDALIELSSLLESKRPQVERYVRVACPAAGTVLASDRLDRYFSLLVNTFGAATGLSESFTYDFFTSLAMAAAKKRVDPRKLPGIEAMVPTSPLVRVLNRPGVEIPADLSVIAGDIQGAGIWQRLKVWATDLFYWQDHDLVVHTKAMYGGVQRTGGARYFFDKGQHVSHFNYFRNRSSATRLLAGLTRGEAPADGYKDLVPGAESALRSARRDCTAPRGVVYLLPGIMGSQLAAGGNEIWMDPIGLANGGIEKLAIGEPGAEPIGIIGSTYAKLVEYLSRDYEVVPFPYDWRRSLLEEGRRFGSELMAKLDATPLPVHVVAHSMGGLLTRAMMAERAEAWDRFKQRSGRVLMLGTPNKGSFFINNMLLGREQLMRGLSLLDFKHSRGEILDIFRQFHGLLEMLPMDSADGDYHSPEKWRELHAALGSDCDWQIPDDADLQAASRLRAVLRDPRTVDTERMKYVAGKAAATPIAIRIGPPSAEADRLVFEATAEGDGRVAWETGLLPGVKTWYVDVEHGQLANHPPTFPAIAELLETGDTKLLSAAPPAARGASRGFKIIADNPPCFPDRENLEAAALGFLPKRERAEEAPKIKVSIKHGDLHFAQSPVLLGHYQADSIVGAERSLDDCLGGKLSERRRLGLYPGPIETTAVVLDDDATPPGAIVVGLGAVGSLSRGELRNTIAKGLVAYSLQAAECRPATDGDSLKVTAMLVGSGTGGVTIENSIEAILEAAVDANRALRGTDVGRLVRIGEVELLELHLDRAVKVSKVLHALANPENLDIRFEISDWRVANGKGGWRRIAYEQDKDWWTRLQITQRDDDQALQFVTLSDRARAEAHMLPTQRASLDAFLQDAVQTTETSSQLSRTLFELLLPNRIKDSMPQARNLVLVVDKKSARYPWELLQDDIATNDEESRSVKPLAVESGIVRQMQTWTFRETVVNTTKLQALVVGDPPTQSFPRLRGAEEEAKAVANQLEMGGFNVQPAIRADFKEILTKLFSHPYRVVHFAGHGVHEYAIENDDDSAHNVSEESAGPSRKKNTVSGMVLGDNVYLTPAEVGQMRVVPELVFINCCHLGAEEGKSSGRDKERFHHLAANLGTQLIQMGARAVVAAGWAVQDQAAKVFAEEFYRQMLVEGSSFGVAVKQAREATWFRHPEHNTWGAYQCYGDPAYVLMPKASRTDENTSEVDDFSVIDEAIIAVENIGAKATTALGKQLQKLRERLVRLIEELPADWSNDAKLLEVLGHACGQAGLYEKAVESYNKARGLERATFSVKAIEQSANLRCRWAVHVWRRSRQLASSHDRDALRDATDEIDKAIDEVFCEAIKDIELLLQIGETKERFSLLGSAYKRQAFVTTGVTRDGALKGMKQAYKKAHRLALTRDGKTDYYPALNWLTARVLQHLRGNANANKLNDVGQWLDRVEADILNSEGEDLSFWSAVARLDTRLVRHLLSGKLDRESRSTLLQGYLKQRPRASAREFGSVLEHLEFVAEVLSEQVRGTVRTAPDKLCAAVQDLCKQLRSAVGEDGLVVDQDS